MDTFQNQIEWKRKWNGRIEEKKNGNDGFMEIMGSTGTQKRHFFTTLWMNVCRKDIRMKEKKHKINVIISYITINEQV